MSVPLGPGVLLADDHAMVRRGLRMVLDAAPDLEVVAEAGDGIEAVERALRETDRPGGARRRHAARDRACRPRASSRGGGRSSTADALDARRPSSTSSRR